MCPEKTRTAKAGADNNGGSQRVMRIIFADGLASWTLSAM
ncbi:hypothetical protein J2Y41_004565 [Arthrobacter sp. 1088]|nr:hypothetical protein [Arthrobacter sp. 1088]